MESQKILQMLDEILNHSLEVRRKGVGECLKLTSDENGKGVKGNVSTALNHQYPHQRQQHSVKRTANNEALLQICVTDRGKRRKKLFRLSRAAAVLKIGYLSRKTTRELNDSINLECDVDAFNWIAEWVDDGGDERIILQQDLLGPVLVAACMLDAPLLLTACLQFWRANAKFVSSAMSLHYPTLPQNVFTQFASLFDNRCLEDLIGDEYLQEKLYQQFIIFLNESPRSEIGHFSSTSRMYICERCSCVVVPPHPPAPCRYVSISNDGRVHPMHRPMCNWSLSEMTQQLGQKYGAWRLVYWFLWATTHFLFCSTCLTSFPLVDLSRCSYHPGSNYQPAKSRYSRWTCCNQRSTFQPVPLSNSGCQQRDHTPRPASTEEETILQICNAVVPLIRTFKTRHPPNEIEMLVPIQEKHLIPDRFLALNVRKKKHGGWRAEWDVGRNQDAQRKREELAMKSIAASFSTGGQKAST